MSKAVVPRWHGDNYQSRFFWARAALLLDPNQPDIIEVTFEADGPKAFDDVVVRYNTGRPSSSSPGRVTVDYHQIKWHVDRSGRFGFEDLINPEFIGATSVSLLERLKQAKNGAENGAAFHLITTDRIRDGDQLLKLISSNDCSFRLDILKKGKTDNCIMGKVRKCWREHLKLATNDELYSILDGFHISEGSPSLENLRHEVSLKFKLVGLQTRDNETTFFCDNAAQQLVIKNINKFDRTSFKNWCKSENWFQTRNVVSRRSIAIFSFPPRPMPEHMRDTLPENTLDLKAEFIGRALKPESSWKNIRLQTVEFLTRMTTEKLEIRLFLETHASIAFLAGSMLRFKLGVDVEVVQKGENNPGIVWNVHDGFGGPDPIIKLTTVGSGNDIALAIGLSRDPLVQVSAYISQQLPTVGTLIHVTPQDGVGQTAIHGGKHAASIAEIIANNVVKIRNPGVKIHIFISGPNAFSFFMGQHAEAMGQCIPYEFDFGGRITNSYESTFDI